MEQAELKTPESLLSRLIETARERKLSEKTITEYRRTWAKLIAWCITGDYSLEQLPKEVAAVFYGEVTAGRSASHHIQVKAALRFVYQFLEIQNPFLACLAPKFDINKVELKYLSAAQVGILLKTLREQRMTYYEHLTYYLAEALFLTAKRYHEWAELTHDRLVQTGAGEIVRLQTKGGKFQHVPISNRLSELLAEWRLFLESVKGVRVRRGGVEFAGSRLVFPGRDGAPYSNEAFNKRLKAACHAAHLPVITAHGLRHSAATLLLNEKGTNIREVQVLLGHRSLSTTARYTHVEHGRLRNIVDALQSV